MDDQVVRSQFLSRSRHVLFIGRPTVYILILLCACVFSCLYKLRADNIFSCQASGYTADTYLAYCDAPGYGDYDHGAFWFGLEPSAEISAKSAEITHFDPNFRMPWDSAKAVGAPRTACMCGPMGNRR